MKNGSQTAKQALSFIYGILFFGVPHLGTKIEQWLPMVQDRPNKALIEAIQPGSQYLKKLNTKSQSAFRFPDSVIVAFYETEETQVAQEVGHGRWDRSGNYERLVEVASATKSHQADCPAIPIPRNHRDRVKFPNRQDQEYETVLNYLREFRQDSLVVIPTRSSTRDQSLFDSVSRLLRPRRPSRVLLERSAASIDSGSPVLLGLTPTLE